MKFTWGTGITVFLTIFIVLAAIFIGFAMRQDVNLVHTDYYERGVDHTEQMKVDARSAIFTDSLQVIPNDDFIMVKFTDRLVSIIDTGGVLLYRPSDSKQDKRFPLHFTNDALFVPKSGLMDGRYILKIHWYEEGLKYEVDKDVFIR